MPTGTTTSYDTIDRGEVSRLDQLIREYRRENGECTKEINDLRRKLHAAKMSVEIVSQPLRRQNAAVLERVVTVTPYHQLHTANATPVIERVSRTHIKTTLENDIYSQNNLIDRKIT
jgi:hypothetical protein